MIRETYVNGVRRERWDDTARTYTSWDQAGTQTSTRAYTAPENAVADTGVAVDTVNANRRTIETALSDALATLQTIIDTPNNGFTLNQLAAAVRDIARVQRRTIRLLIGRFDGTA